MIGPPKIRSSAGQTLSPLLNAVELAIIGVFWVGATLFAVLFIGIFSWIILRAGPSATLLLYTAIALLLTGIVAIALAFGLMLAGVTLQHRARRGPPQ